MRRPIPPAALIAVAVLAALVVAAPAHAQEGAEEMTGATCREVRSLDGTQYWFWDGYFGLVDVHDLPYERWGRLGVDPSICFRVALTVIEDPRQHTAGYRQAIDELLKWVTEDGDDQSSKLAVRELRRITGKDFKHRSGWSEWWQENQAYVLWSEEEKRLEVVAEAHDAGEAINDDALLLSAEEYWFYMGRGWVASSTTVGSFVLGTVNIPPHGYSFRVEAAALDDRGAKERGYRRALENLVVDGLLSPDLSAPELESVLDRVAALAGPSPEDRAGWIRWWRSNHERLVLSPDGDRLVVR